MTEPICTYFRNTVLNASVRSKTADWLHSKRKVKDDWSVSRVSYISCTILYLCAGGSATGWGCRRATLRRSGARSSRRSCPRRTSAFWWRPVRPAAARSSPPSIGSTNRRKPSTRSGWRRIVFRFLVNLKTF